MTRILKCHYNDEGGKAWCGQLGGQVTNCSRMVDCRKCRKMCEFDEVDI